MKVYRVEFEPDAKGVVETMLIVSERWSYAAAVAADHAKGREIAGIYWEEPGAPVIIDTGGSDK